MDGEVREAVGARCQGAGGAVREPGEGACGEGVFAVRGGEGAVAGEDQQQDVEIGLAVEKLGRSSVRYRLGVFASGAEEAAAEGHFVHVYVGRESRRPVEVPEAWRARLSEIAGE